MTGRLVHLVWLSASVACGGSSTATPVVQQPPAACVDEVDCHAPVGEGKQCGDLVAPCTGAAIHCACAEGLDCIEHVCKPRPVADPRCVPRTECSGGGRGASCGRVEAGCPGVYLQCGCDYGLTCQGGACMPAHMPCDPVSPRQVCPGPVPAGGACGQVSAGCPGAFVQCGCAAGLRCQDGTCR